ncbi:MAG: sialidase family protein [Polaromonas sp.]
MDRLALLFLAVAFALAGWKIAECQPAGNFVSLAHPTGSSPGSGQKDSVAPAVAAEARPPPEAGRLRLDADFVSSSPGQAVHAASLVELRDGRLRAVWFSGSREGAGDVAIKSAVLDAATHRWSDETTLYDRERIQRGLWRYVKKIGNPVIARAPDGSLLLWMVNVSLGGWAGSSITWARSDDEGVTWSGPKRLVTSPFLNISTLVKGAPFFYQNGEIGLPVYHEFVSKFSEILRISVQGKIIDKARIPGSQTQLQPIVMVTDETHAQMYMRSGRAVAVMTSQTTDAGKTWSATRATNWPNPDSALAGVVTADRRQWLALNPGQKNREVLALLQTSLGGSFDGARPWIVESGAVRETRLSVTDFERLLGDELKSSGASESQTRAYVGSARRQLCVHETCSEEFSYPFLLQSRDGFLHMVYTWHRTRIKHVRLDPLQVFQALPVAPAVIKHAATH